MDFLFIPCRSWDDALFSLFSLSLSPLLNLSQCGVWNSCILDPDAPNIEKSPKRLFHHSHFHRIDPSNRNLDMFDCSCNQSRNYNRHHKPLHWNGSLSLLNNSLAHVKWNKTSSTI